MGGRPPHDPGPGGVPVPGGAKIYGEVSAAAEQQEMGIHLGGSGKVGGRIRGNERLNFYKVEHGRTVYRYKIASGPV